MLYTDDNGRWGERREEETKEVRICDQSALRKIRSSKRPKRTSTGLTAFEPRKSAETLPRG